MISLGFLGFDAASVKSLSIAIASRAADVCQYAEPEDANVILVDIDKMQNPDQWRELRQSRSMTLIAASHDSKLPAVYENDFVTLISKPLRFTLMMSSICEAANIDQCEITQITKSAVVGDIIEDGHKRRTTDVLREQKQIDPDKYLLGLVLDAVKKHSSDQYRYIKLSEGKRWSDGQWLVINKPKDRVLLSISPVVVGHTAIMDFSNHNIIEQWISAEQFKELKDLAVWETSIEEFIWALTRDTVRNGQLKTFNPDIGYRLKHWPNLTRYSAGNHDIALSSYWIENTASANQLTEKLNVPVQEAYAFANCCFTAGLLTEVKDADDSSVPAQQKGIKKVLSMILNKLDRT